ncbi:MAG: hypothetical protein JEZ14_03845 [Marinilabiliaceae bacterium]|nr:hypothetical protein [Marinilabiliaceae bacterium]
MKQPFINLAILIMAFACQLPSEKVIYQSEAFTIEADRVVQGEYTAKVLSPTHMASDYQSPANDNFPNFIEFKLAINGKDNEMPMGVNHTFVLNARDDGMIQLPQLIFGEKHADEQADGADGSIAANMPFKVKVDCRKVMKSFEENGYFETFDGDKIYKDDFKGFYIAGNLSPLSWDFDNLAGRTDKELTDTDGDGIYEITLALNPFNPEDFTAKAWTLKNDISNYPQLQSAIPLIDALYNLSLDETVMNKEADGTFRTGEAWPGVWTRDISYSILLAYAYLDPEMAKTSLMHKVQNQRIIQDTGTGGAWPVSSDRTTWAVAAWEIYKVTGDQQWLDTIYPIIMNSVEDDLKTLKDEKNDLIKGESSFLDWRKQTYPVWMNGVDIFESRTLGTNAVHYQTYSILAEISELMGKSSQRYQQEALKVKRAINEWLWVEEAGYYGQYLYGRQHLMLSPRSEALGEAHTILFGIADASRAQTIVNNTPIVNYGIPCIYPQIPGIPPYHNNGIWPFVQAYWNWACAKTKHMDGLEHGLAGLYRSAALFLTNKENMVADNGDFRDTEVNSNRQLWSVAGNLAMVYRVFLGMDFQVEGLHFDPMIPENYGDHLAISNFKYRDMVLDIEVTGTGDQVKTFLLDGKSVSDPFIDGSLAGKHTVKIVLQGSKTIDQPVAMLPNKFSLETPIVKRHHNTLVWNPVTDATLYLVYKNGKEVAQISDTEYVFELSNLLTEYTVKAVNDSNYSFISEPVSVIQPKQISSVQAEQFGKVSKLDCKGYNGTGFIELSHDDNRKVKFRVSVPQTGSYFIDFRYSNGSGPDNTDNKCAIRSLYANKTFAGVVVMPQRGKDEWSNWGWSNGISVDLLKGENELLLSFEHFNANMNGAVNRAMLDQMRIRRVN